jgi:hypothetical protein
LTNPTRPFKTVAKDRLFYDQFEYCIGFHLDEVSALRELDHVRIDDLIQRRKAWREVAQQRWINGKQKHGTIMTRAGEISLIKHKQIYTVWLMCC